MKVEVKAVSNGFIMDVYDEYSTIVDKTLVAPTKDQVVEELGKLMKPYIPSDTYYNDDAKFVVEF